MIPTAATANRCAAAGRNCFQLAGILGAAYLALCSVYVWFSGLMASRLATDVSALQDIELLKGLAFVLITTCMFTAFAYFLLRKIHLAEQKLQQQHTVLEMYQQQASAGLLASSIAHDMNNMLMVLQAGTMQLADSPGLSGSTAEHAWTLQQHVDQLISLAQRLQTSARASVPTEFEEIHLPRLAKELLQFVKQHPKAGEVRFSLHCEDHVSLRGNPIVLRQILLNLLINAVDATAGNAGAHVELKLLRDAVEPAAVLEIHDNGPGVPTSQHETIFTPYFTTKNSGTGLGLLSVKAGVKEHEGSISVGKSPLGGACFRLRLPA